MANGMFDPGTVRPISWYHNSRCTACRERRAEVMVLVRGDYRGVYWTRACPECASTLSTMAALGEVVPDA